MADDVQKIIKKTHRELREDLQENRLEYTNPNSDGLEKALDTMNSVFHTVTKTSDIMSDWRLVYDTAITFKERVKNVHCEYRSFKNAEFMDRIRRIMKHGKCELTKDEDGDDNDDDTEYVLTRENLMRFGKNAMSYFKIPPKTTFLNGILEKEQVEIVKRQRKQREKPQQDSEVKKTAIAEVETGKTTSDRNQTVTEVERIYKRLYQIYKKLKDTPISLFEFIIHPTSFSRTIENLFYLSFLVKDGYVKMFLDDNGLPVIEPLQLNECAGTKDNQKLDSNNVNIQSMISLTKDEWKELIDVFGIETPLIKDLK